MSELPVKATLKAGGGYDAPWLTVDANDPADLAFKMKALIEHESALQLVVEAANLLKAVNSAAPILAPVAGQQEAPTPPPSEQPKQPAWGQTPAAPQQTQQAPPPAQTRQTNQYGGQLHPEGKTCETCPQVLERKQTSSGKPVWRCPAWRWQNGNPNGHSQEWID